MTKHAHAQILYSLHSGIDRNGSTEHRITKFVDGEVESSYLTTLVECECPAGARPSCRHRQMLPMMLASGIANTHWFWDFDSGRVVDFFGQLKSNLDALNELAAQNDRNYELDQAFDQLDAVAEGVVSDSTSLEDSVKTERVTERVSEHTGARTSWRRL